MSNKVKAATKRLEFTVKAFEMKDASDECIIEGYANTSSKDRVGDVVFPKAFEKTLPTYLKNPVLLVNHDWSDLGGKVLKAEITETGLYIKARISDNRKDIKTFVREGCLSTFSIGYNEIDADYDESTKTKFIKELELLEISVVTVPANTEASFTVAETKDQEPTSETKPDAAKPEKSAPRTATQLADFIGVVKSAVNHTLTEKQIFAVCEYFKQEGEIMTREELIAALKGKSVEGAAPAAPASNDGAKEGDKPAADGQPKDKLDEILAKLEMLGQAMAQMMEAAKPAEESKDEPKDEEKPEEDQEDEKSDDKDQDADKDEEMSDEEVEKELAEIESQITEIENTSDEV